MKPSVCTLQYTVKKLLGNFWLKSCETLRNEFKWSERITEIMERKPEKEIEHSRLYCNLPLICILLYFFYISSISSTTLEGTVSLLLFPWLLISGNIVLNLLCTPVQKCGGGGRGLKCGSPILPGLALVILSIMSNNA